MKDKSELMLFSNLMLDDDQHTPKYKYMPGDYVPLVFREFRDKRNWSSLSARQIAELTEYVVCARCNRACAGTCEDEPEARLTKHPLDIQKVAAALQKQRRG